MVSAVITTQKRFSVVVEVNRISLLDEKLPETIFDLKYMILAKLQQFGLDDPNTSASSVFLRIFENVRGEKCSRVTVHFTLDYLNQQSQKRNVKRSDFVVNCFIDSLCKYEKTLVNGGVFSH